MAQRKYKTSQGDTWSMIAYQVYGDAYEFVRLLEANRQYAHILRFDAEPITLTIPEQEAPRVAFALPPWQEVSR